MHETKTRRNKVVVVGSHVQGLFMRISRFPVADETVLGWNFKEALDGGKGSHQAIACARLGLPTHFVGRIGQDRWGQAGASWMTEAGIDLTYLCCSEQTATGCSFVMIDPTGVPAIVTAMGANQELSSADIDCAEAVLRQARVVLITFEIPVVTALYAARKAKESGAFTILTPGPAEPLPQEALSFVDLLVPNRGEAKILAGPSRHELDSPEELAARLQERFGIKKIVITLGENGAFVVDGEKKDVINAFKVVPVDTPGAGDAFCAGLAFGLFEGGCLTDAAQFGALTAARAVTIGDSIPGFGTLGELETFAESNNFKIPSAFCAASGGRIKPAKEFLNMI